MCGRAMLTVSADDLQQTFGYRAPRGYKPRFNIAPSQPLVALTGSDSSTFVELIWGFIPPRVQETAPARRLINARAETVAQKPAFRSAFESRRCLVVIDGYYEWQQLDGVRRPHRICLAGREPFTVAAIWEPRGTATEGAEGCAIITTAASSRTAGIHDRMPAIVPAHSRDRWLNGETHARELQGLLIPYEGDDLEAYEVSPLVNNPANDLPECLEPYIQPAVAPKPAPSGRGRRRAVSSEVLDLFSTSDTDS